ncbi:MAG: N-acetylmuramoyl-L-alanine amidase [Bacillota bacterium]
MSPSSKVFARIHNRQDQIRRWFAVFIAAAVLGVTLSSGAAPAAAAARVKLVINGTVVSSDVAPSITNSRVMVPIRVISEHFGATVGYETKTRTVTVVLNGTIISLKIGDKRAYVNKKLVTLVVPAAAVSGRTIVPLRFVSEALGATVDWDAKAYAVYIHRDGIVSGVTYDKGLGSATVTIAVKGGVAGFTTTVAKNPDRLIVDLKGTVLGLPQSAYDFNDPALTRVRTGVFSTNPNVSRVILDFPEATPAQVITDSQSGSVKVTFGYKVTSIGMETRGQERVIVVGTTGPVKSQTATLQSPSRAIIDVQGASLSAALTQPTVAVDDATVSQLSVSQVASPQVVRVIADLKKPVGIGVEATDQEAIGHFLATINTLSYDKATGGAAHLTLDTSQGVTWKTSRLADPNRLIIDVPFAAATNLGPAIAPGDGLVSNIAWSVQPDNPSTVRLTITSPSILACAASASPDGKQVTFALTPSSVVGKLIVVDPGHGGADPGARGYSGSLEKDIDLAIALDLRDALVAAGARVLMTRSEDIDVGLYARPQMANAADADLFISVHNNAYDYQRSGTETYYTNTNPLSHALANAVHHSVVGSLGTIDRGVRTEPFVVIRESKMPSVLVEGLYLSTKGDEKRLKDPVFQRNLAQAIMRGVADFYAGND